jgi:hypothetical protein
MMFADSTYKRRGNSKRGVYITWAVIAESIAPTSDACVVPAPKRTVVAVMKMCATVEVYRC